MDQYTAVLAEPEVEAEAEANGWEGTIVLEGVMTGDGRMIESGALRWETPFPIRHVVSDVGAHDGAVVVGTVRSITRTDDGKIHATGTFDLGSEHGVEARRQVAEGLTTGVSVDLDDVSFEIRIAGDLLEEMEGDEAPDVDEDGRVKVLEMDADDEVRITTDARIRAVTLVAIPAFDEAHIAISDRIDDTDEEEDESLTAGAAPARPPASWFDSPNLTEPTPLQVRKDGRVFGHIALWGTCHTGHAGECTEPPTSKADYAYFRTGAIETDDGKEVAVGRITIDTTHADTRSRRLNAAQVQMHYDNTGSTVAYVTAGEDSHGIWVAGTLKPDATEEQVRALRASPLSGDWRRIGSSLELLAVLAVNGPGFPVPRPQGMVASGRMEALIASTGMMLPNKVLRPGTPGALSDEDLKYLKHLAASEKQRQQRERTATAMRLRAKVNRADNLEKINQFISRRSGN